jgi:hypothetical protein
VVYNWAALWLNVTNNHNVLISCYGASKLQEFATRARGAIVREISLQPLITNPRHSMPLSSGQFVVSHDGAVHRVCLVGVDGRVVCSYGGCKGSGDQQLNMPVGLALGRDGCVLVADYWNHRVVVMDSSLTRSRVVPLTVDGGFQNPFSLWLDVKGRLYVGEYDGGRVFVFENVHNLEGLLSIS